MASSAVQHWSQQARYDLQTARAMWDAGRYVYVAFCGQQAMEKALKAVLIARSGELPPRIHNLPRLAELAEISLDAQQLDFLAAMSLDYLRTRYPDEMDKLSRSFTRARAESVLQRCEEMTPWLLSMIE